MQSIFISSTFKDMQSERDLLQYEIFPKIRRDIRTLGEDIHLLDLRWGVDTLHLSEQDSGKMVLKVCIDAIDRCIPFIIIFLGERYGWIPGKDIITKNNDTRIEQYYKEGMSITNLEIEYGAFSLQNDIDKCIFCFRNPVVNDSINPDFRHMYDTESEEHREKLEQLKNKIRQIPNATIIDYDAGWDDEKNRITGLDSLKENLYRSLKEKIWTILEDKTHLHPYEQMKREMVLTQEQHLSTYVDRYKDENAVLYYISEWGVGKEKQLHIKASSGVGKTALMSKLAKLYQDIPMRTILCYGGVNGCQSYRKVKEYLIYNLEDLLEIEHLEEYPFVDERLVYLDQKIGYKKIVCFIDALDQIFQNENQVYLDIFDLCPHMSFVVSSLDDFIITNDDLPHLEINELLDDQVRHMILNTTKLRGKNLGEEIMREIMQKKYIHNPLYLSNVLQRLFMINAKEFEAAEAMAPGIEGIYRFMKKLLHEMPDGRFGMIPYLIEEAASYFEGSQFQKIIALLDVSRNGLTENEIQEILALDGMEFNPLLFSQMVTYLYDVFVQQKNGKWTFKHRLYKEAMKDDERAMELLCQYSLQNKEFMENEGYYYVLDQRHEEGYFVFENKRIEHLQEYFIILLEKGEEYFSYLTAMAEKADCNIAFSFVSRLNHKKLNHFQNCVLEKLYKKKELSYQHKADYLIKKMELSALNSDTYISCARELKELALADFYAEAKYYYESGKYYYYVNKIDDAIEAIQNAIDLLYKERMTEEKLLDLCEYVRLLCICQKRKGSFPLGPIKKCLSQIEKDCKNPKIRNREISLMALLSRGFVQNKYFDIEKVRKYREEAIKRAKEIVEELPSADNMKLLVSVYEDVKFTLKKEYRYEYYAEIEKYRQKIYDLTRQETDLFRLADAMFNYAKSMTEARKCKVILKDAEKADKDIFCYYKQSSEYYEQLYKTNPDYFAGCAQYAFEGRAELAYSMVDAFIGRDIYKGEELLTNAMSDPMLEKAAASDQARWLDALLLRLLRVYKYKEAAVFISKFEKAISSGAFLNKGQYKFRCQVYSAWIHFEQDNDELAVEYAENAISMGNLDNRFYLKALLIKGFVLLSKGKPVDSVISQIEIYKENYVSKETGPNGSKECDLLKFAKDVLNNSPDLPKFWLSLSLRAQEYYVDAYSERIRNILTHILYNYGIEHQMTGLVSESELFKCKNLELDDYHLIQVARYLFTQNQFESSLEAYSKVAEKETLNQYDCLTMQLSQLMDQYKKNQLEKIISLPEIIIEERDDYTKYVSVVYTFIKMVGGNQRKANFLKAVRMLLFELLHKKNEHLIAEMLICFIEEYPEYDCLTSEEAGDIMYKIATTLIKIKPENYERYYYDISYKIAKIYEQSKDEKYRMLAESFYMSVVYPYYDKDFHDFTLYECNKIIDSFEAMIRCRENKLPYEDQEKYQKLIFGAFVQKYLLTKDLKVLGQYEEDLRNAASILSRLYVNKPVLSFTLMKEEGEKWKTSFFQSIQSLSHIDIVELEQIIMQYPWNEQEKLQILNSLENAAKEQLDEEYKRLKIIYRNL